MGSAERDGEVPAFEVFPGEGPPLLLIHGLLSSRRQWQPNLSALARISRPVVLELWGHGRSAAPVGDTAYSVSFYLDAFEEIRRQVGADRWFVCGQSYGAGLAIHYALRHADRTRGLIFTNSRSALAAGRLHHPRDEPSAATRADLEALPGKPDIVNFVVPPPGALAIAKQAVALGIRRLWFQPGSESDELKAWLTEQEGVSALTDACIMVQSAA